MNKYYRALASLIFAALIVIPACGGGGGGGSSSPPFAQADLKGAWYVSILQSSQTLSGSSEPGWIRGQAMVDSAGNVDLPDLETSGGPGPGPIGVVLTIDPWTGIISESGTGGNPDFHGKLAANKQLIVGTATNLNSLASTTTVQLRVMQKILSNVTYTMGDLADKNFMMHQLATGANSDWGYASGSTDSSAVVSITTLTTSSGSTSGPISVGTMSFLPGTGFVTMSTNSSFGGMMSPDKTYFVATETDQSNSGIFRLSIVQIQPLSPSFTISDIVGSWHFHGLVNNLPAWVYQSLTVNSLGLATITSQLTSMGTNTNLPEPAYLSMDPDGIVTVPTDTTFHGSLSANKDLLVSTQTITDNGFFPALGIIIK